MRYTALITLFSVSLCLTLLAFRSRAQTKADIDLCRQRYEGAWVNPRVKRHLTIAIDKDGTALINDQTITKEPSSVDAYYAKVVKGKLVSPADIEHHGDYIEIRTSGKQLLLETRFKDIKGKPYAVRTLFIRE